jgi:hypothetical protein
MGLAGLLCVLASRRGDGSLADWNLKGENIAPLTWRRGADIGKGHGKTLIGEITPRFERRGKSNRLSHTSNVSQGWSHDRRVFSL